MNYWLVKSEPSEYSWEDLSKNREDIWDGIRNFQARNYLKEMKCGDQVLFYHSGKTKEIVGVAEVSEEAFPDPKDNENKGWVAIKIKPKKALKNPIDLERIKSDDLLNTMPLIKQSRLSVMPIEKIQFDHIIKLSS
ncbi:EVE domain-containing protein [Cecembia calidifontis]|jgi:predicted RNA-binding protein with PUA-like domain|uniref:Putative RNA-binding protein with PUA-like domain n=1 Tax=Cecembia calidifontis TaxID=1187080 RepID=A0A4Q7PG50_9BACT|nr:EVE domain-containing protein [Cecembia calidifontis]RZS98700.1 putative RNA-binding protein with PUA-like domain [Cecembia calidifontis]